MQLDLPLRRQHHQLRQIIVAPHQVPDEVDLRRDDVDRGDIDVLAVPDDVVVARAAEHLDAGGGGAAFGHEVDDGFATLAVGQFEDFFDELA